MTSVTATINVQINAANAAAQLTALQSKVAAMNKGMLAATAGGVMAQEKAIRRMGNVLSGSGMFTTGIRNVHTELGRMHQEFDRGSTTLQKYRQNSRSWGKDHSAINRMAADRVRMLQSQYVALGKEMNGVQQAMQIKPDRMMREFGADAEYAHQRATLFRRNLQMGSTALVNWGKNTQWAGRQMMVGMGIPIAIAAAGAIKSFNDIEKASIAFKRVYGDTTTSVAEKSQMLVKMQKTVGTEMMKYGIAMSDTLDVSAKAAATGAQGADLIAATRETMRLATLGNMDYNKALEATIAMQTAFNINSKDMAKTTDFLNAVENQTILSMEDMALAVPRVAPVIKGLGGNVEDLAIMMTALRQGGVSAEQGANALKSGLGSLLNPTGTAIEQFDGLGVNLEKIVDTNKGDLIGTIQGLGKALDGLTKYDRQRALESLFGKYQYARMGALLKNINSKAVRETMKMAKASPGELAKMSEAELAQISDSPMIKLRKSIEELKAAAAPLGALFSDIAAKVISFATPIVSFFANNDVAKWGLVASAGFAALAGVITMVVGVFANFSGSMVKAGMALKSFFRLITGQRSLAYVTTDELQASAAANSLASAAERAAGGMMAEAKAAQLLTSQLDALIAAQNGAAATTRRSGPGTTGMPVAPKPSGPVVPTPAVGTSSFTQAQKVAMLTREGTTVRSHVGQPMVFNKQQLAAIEKYHEAGVAKGQKSAIAFTEAARAGTLRGYSSMALGWGANTNMELSDSAKSLGVDKSRLLAQLQMRPQEVMAPFLDDLARNSGMTTEQVVSDPRVKSWASDTVNRLHSGIAQSAVQTFKDSDVDRIASPILSSVKDIAPEYAKGYGRMMLPEEYGVPGQPRVSLQKGVVDQAPEQFAATRPKTVKTSDAVAMSNTHLANLRIGPGEEVTPNGLVVPKGTMEQQRQTAQAAAKSQVKPTTSTGNNMPGLFDSWDKNKQTTKSTGSSRYQKALANQQSKYGMRGMGLMGAGMLASTAFMGMEMAGKEVPAAASFAANGLMGVGMAAQMFPGTMQKVSTGLLSVAGMLGPWGIAIGAAIAAVGGTALAWRKINIDARKSGNELAQAMNDTVTSANDVAQAFGNTAYVTQQAAKDAGTTTEQMTAAQQFLASPVGKQFMDDYSKTASQTTAAIAASSAGAKIASWVVQGVLTGENVKGLVAAVNTQSPGMGTVMAAQARQYLGKGFTARNPAEVARLIFGQQGINSAQATSMLRKRADATTPPTNWDYARAAGKSAIGGPMQWAYRFLNKDGSFEDKARATTPIFDKLVQGTANRVEDQKLTAATSGVWNSQLKTAFQNRMAVEVQLKAMVSERNKLQRKKQAGTATSDDIKQLKNLKTQIESTRTSQKKFDTELNAGFKNAMGMPGTGQQGEDWYTAQLDAARNAGKKDPMTAYMAEQINAQKGVTAGFDTAAANKAMTALNTGIMSPTALNNLSNGGTELKNISATLDTLPADKVQQAGLALQNMTGDQAQNKLTTFNKGFRNLAKDIGLSKKQATDWGLALGLKQKAIDGINPGKMGAGKMPKDLTRKIKERYIEDRKAKQKPKDQELKIKAKADTDGAEKKIKGLGATVDATSKKKINIRASVNVGGAEKKIKGLGAAADTGASVEQVINRVIGNDETRIPPAPLIQIISRIIGLDMSLIPAIPLFQTVNRILGSTNLPPIPDAIQYVKRVPKNAMGGEVVTGYFASGGMHAGDGKVTGPGGPTDDKVNARLSDGEFVIRASSVDKYGTAFLSAINQGRYEKQAYKNGTVPGAKLAPKKSDAEGRKADFNNSWKNTMWEIQNFLNEFKAMPTIIKKSTNALKGRFKQLGTDFGRYLMDTYDPKEINKIFSNKAAKKKVARQFMQQQRLEAKDQLRQGELDLAAMRAARESTGYGAAATAAQNLSGDDIKLARSQPKIFKKIFKQRTSMEQANQNASWQTAIRKTDANIVGQLGGDSRLASAAESLGVSMEDVANAIANGKSANHIIELGQQAKAAAEALEVLKMDATDRKDENRSNLESIAGLYGEKAAASARLNIGNQAQQEALMAMNQAKSDIAQATVDDINQKYEKQLEIFDQISQQQQAIANLERGRLSVANALSTGDIAAAAMAAQEQRSNTASFMQEQMRNQLTNQQKAQTAALEEQIAAWAKENRDMQNAINLEVAKQQGLVAMKVDEYQREADIIAVNNGLIDEQIAKLITRNSLLQNATIPAPSNGDNPAPGSEQYPNLPQPKIGDVVRKAKKKKKKAFGGWVPGVGNSDNVPLLATPGEFVMRKAAAARFGPTLQAMNSGSIKDIGGSGGGVNIDNIIFNINGANLDERAVADIAVRKMKSLDSATIRGGRF